VAILLVPAAYCGAMIPLNTHEDLVMAGVISPEGPLSATRGGHGDKGEAKILEAVLSVRSGLTEQTDATKTAGET